MSKTRACFLARLTRDAIDLGHALRLVGCPAAGGPAYEADPRTGAVVGFTGIIRALEDKRPLRGILYEEYRSMARKEMKRILDEARRRWTLHAAVVLHRTGPTPVGHPSVAVAVAAGHRAEAFDAARFLIDAVKERVPLWKNFIYAEKHPMRQPTVPKLWIAVPIQSQPESPAEFVRRVRAAGGNAMELRADALHGLHAMSPDAIRRLAAELRRADPRIALILTPRARAEGGVAALSIARRKQIIEVCLPEVDALDVELKSRGIRSWAAAQAAQAGKLLILSNHDFVATPSIAALNRLYEEAERWPGALLKIAAATSRRGDLLRLARWTQSRVASRPLATMSMGATGAAGRLLLAALGSRIAFASLGQASAPGQIELRTFTRSLRRLRAAMKTSGQAAKRTQLQSLLIHAERILGPLS